MSRRLVRSRAAFWLAVWAIAAQALLPLALAAGSAHAHGRADVVSHIHPAGHLHGTPAETPQQTPKSPHDGPHGVGHCILCLGSLAGPASLPSLTVLPRGERPRSLVPRLAAIVETSGGAPIPYLSRGPPPTI
jgi:hypothetical protein